MTSHSAIAILLSFVLAGAAEAGTVYRWTDAQGVVHFADVPPPSVWTYSTETMSGSAPVAKPDDAAPVAPPVEGEAAAKPAEPAPPTGPAQLVIVDREEASLGGSAQSFSGKIKNQGGTAAHDVSIAIRVVEPSQGDECINDAITVSPSTLAPGATATFEADFASPCFAGPTQTELRVEWD